MGLIQIGTSGWSYPHWRNRFYPAELSKADWLKFYAQNFSTVELNTTFYRLPQLETVARWRQDTPPAFRFAVKAHRLITHLHKLHNVQQPLDKFLERISGLRDKLGPILYQLPAALQRDDERLASFLKLLPGSYPQAIEFRHPSWYTETVYEQLRQHQVAFCIHDRANCQSPVVTTTEFAYVRLHGPDGTYTGSYSEAAIADWANKIQALGQHLKTIYVYFNNDQNGYAVDNARTLAHLL